jgi:hypothetical protein
MIAMGRELPWATFRGMSVHAPTSDIPRTAATDASCQKLP